MNLTFLNPNIELSPFVRKIWHYENAFGFPVKGQNILAPNGCPKLIILLENSLVSTCLGNKRAGQPGEIYLTGNYDASIILHAPPQKTSFIVVEFFPHGAFPIFGVPMSTTEQPFSSKWSNEVYEGICDRSEIEDRIHFLQKKLVQQLREKNHQDALVSYCVNEIQRTAGCLAIKNLEHQTGYSRRYLEILFNKHVGLTPKVLARIIRFQTFYKKWAAGETAHLIKSDLYDFYYDQAHFSREFKKMTGYPLGKYVNFTNTYGRQISLGEAF